MSLSGNIVLNTLSNPLVELLEKFLITDVRVHVMHAFSWALLSKPLVIVVCISLVAGPDFDGPSSASTSITARDGVVVAFVVVSVFGDPSAFCDDPSTSPSTGTTSTDDFVDGDALVVTECFLKKLSICCM